MSCCGCVLQWILNILTEKCSHCQQDNINKSSYLHLLIGQTWSVQDTMLGT